MAKENQRVRISKMMLKNALLELLEKKPIEKISVHEICQTAEVNRTTFYKYYGNEMELLREITDDFFGKLEENLSNLGESKSDSLDRALKYLNEYRKTFQILVNSIPDELFTERLFSMPEIRDALYKNMGSPDTAEKRRYMEMFFFYGGYAIIRAWLNSDNPEPASEIAGMLHYLGDKMR